MLAAALINGEVAVGALFEIDDVVDDVEFGQLVGGNGAFPAPATVGAFALADFGFHGGYPPVLVESPREL